MKTLLLLAAAGALVSGASGADSVWRVYFARSNELRTVASYGNVRRDHAEALGEPFSGRPKRHWIARAQPLGQGAPPWARRLYRRSLLVMEAVVAPSGAAVAGLRKGWEFVWPRDAATVAMALSAAGMRSEARRITRFLLGLDLGAAARFRRDGSPVDGRAAQGDAAGWVAAAACATGLPAQVTARPWRDRADYQETTPGDYLGDVLASAFLEERREGDGPDAIPLSRPPIRREFAGPAQTLVREGHEPGSGLDSAAAWAVRPFPQPHLFGRARRTLLRLASRSGRFGLLPSEAWTGGEDPWTAPTAWTAWSLAVLARQDRHVIAPRSRRERLAALRLMLDLRRDATPAGLLPERVDAVTGVPTSTTPLAWSHAFAILALRELWPAQAGRRQRPSQ